MMQIHRLTIKSVRVSVLYTLPLQADEATLPGSKSETHISKSDEPKENGDVTEDQSQVCMLSLLCTQMSVGTLELKRKA